MPRLSPPFQQAGRRARPPRWLTCVLLVLAPVALHAQSAPSGGGGGNGGGGGGGGVTPYVVSTFSLTHNGDGTASVPVNATTTTTFTAQNLGGASVTASFVVTACSGALKPGSCTVSPGSATLAPNASTTVTATFIGGAAAGSGTLTVAAKQGSTTLATSSVAVTVTAAPGGPTVSTSPHRGDVLDVSQCVADCFETTFGYSTPAYVSLDVPRSVTLLYRGGRASPYGRVTLGAIDGNGSVTSFRLQLADPNGVNVTFTNGATSLFFAKKSGDTTRIAAEFDASTIATSAGLYTASVTSYAGSTPLGTTAKAVRIIVVNDRASVYGAGVDIVGVQRLFTVAGQSPGVLVTDGSGSASFFAGNCTTSSACSFTSPGGEFSTLTTVVGAYKRTYPDGTVVTFTSAGLDTSVVDPFGTRTRYAWVFNADAGKTVLSTITDPTGQVTSFYYRPASNLGGFKLGTLGAIYSPGARESDFGVLASNDLQVVVDPDGLRFAVLGYDAQHRLVADTNKAGGVASYNYAYGKTLSYVDAPTVVLAGNVSARPRVQVREAYSGLYSAAALQLKGKVVTDAIPVPQFDIRAAVTDPRGNSTFYTLGRFGSPTRIDAPLTNPAYVTYDTLTGQVTRSVSPTGAVQRFAWVADQLRQTIDSSSGTTVNIDYETSYSLPLHVYGNVAEQWYTYDKTKAGWPLKTTKIGLSTATPTTYTFDAYGRPTSVIDPSSHTTTYAYATTGLRNHSGVTAPNRPATTYLQDAYGRDTLVKDPYLFTNRQRYDALNRLVWTLSPLTGDSTTFQYDPLNNPTVVRDAKGQVYTTQRNALGWVVKQVDPAGRSDSAAYDVGGNVTYTKSRGARETTFDYDALGRITRQSGAHDTISFTYNTTSRWVGATSISRGVLVSTDTIFADSLGRTIKEHTIRPGSGSAWQVSSYYGAGDPGRGSVTVYRDGMPYTETEMNYAFDASKRLSMMSSGYAGQTTFGYDAEQILSSVSLPTNTAFVNLVETIQHTSTHALSQRSFNATNVQAAMGRSYQTDSLSRVIQRESGTAGKFQSFSYDAKGRFTFWAKKIRTSGQCINIDGYGYDCSGTGWVPDGSPVGTSYDNVENHTDLGAVLDPGNRLRWYNGFSMTYDNDGNLVKKVGATTDSLDWDDFGQLRAVIRGGAAIATFSYDGFGRRVKKVTPTATIQYVWDGDQLMVEADANGAQIRSYAYYPGIDQLHSVRSNGIVYYAAIEPGGDVDGLVRRSDTTVVAQYAYTPWGEIETEQQTVSGQPLNSLRWKGLLYDAETGLYYVRARYYDPKLRRFISEDPIGLEGGMNEYAFAAGDPINISDPSGQDCVSITFPDQWMAIKGKGDEGDITWPIHYTTARICYDRSEHLYSSGTSAQGGQTGQTTGAGSTRYYERGIESAGLGPVEFIPIGGFAAMTLRFGDRMLGKTGIRIVEHGVERMFERKITDEMIEEALTRGVRYADQKYNTIAHVLENYVNGKSLTVWYDATKDVVTSTLLSRRNPVRPWYIALPN